MNNISTRQNDIKKALYKEKPTAKMINLDVDTKVTTYVAHCSLGDITFEVPEVENEDFDNEIPAQLLIRWML